MHEQNTYREQKSKGYLHIKSFIQTIKPISLTLVQPFAKKKNENLLCLHNDRLYF